MKNPADVDPAAVQRSIMRLYVPPGHYYSPLTNPDELQTRRDLFSEDPSPRGIDYRYDAQRELLETLAPLIATFDYPQERTEGRYFWQYNSEFAGLDARVYYALLQHLRPKLVIEIGSGYSTLLALDVRERLLGEFPQMIAIEPYPEPELQVVNGKVQVLVHPVWDIDVSIVDLLQPGDILFYDGTHVVKTGSDVLYVYLEMLPRLRPGVYIHIHDICLPYEYPADWVLTQNRSWNEQYMLEALLTDSSRYEVVFTTYGFAKRFPADVERVCGAPVGGGSMWLRVR